MKIFTEGWDHIFKWLPVWSRLSLETRELFATRIPSDLRIPAEHFDPNCVAELRCSGFITSEARRLTTAIRPFRRAVRAMHRHRLFDEPDYSMRTYIEDHLTENEAVSLTGQPSYYVNHWKRAEQYTSDESWLRCFLDAPIAADWEQQHTDQQRDACLAKAPAAEMLSKLIHRCLDSESPIPLSELIADYEDNPEATANALTAAIRYLLLFVALRSDTLEPVIGVWPSVHKRINQKTASRPSAMPEPPDGARTFGTPFLLHDITTLLVGTAPNGLRVRRSYGVLFKREIDKLISHLTPLPEGLDSPPSSNARINVAFCWLLSTKLAKIKGANGKQPVLAITPQGKEWLAKPIGDRLRDMLDVLIIAYEKRTDRHTAWSREYLSFVSHDVNSDGWGYNAELDTHRHLRDGFETCECGLWIPRADFLDWHAETLNPLLRHPGKSRSPYDHLRNQTTPQKEREWRKYVDNFITHRLVPLDGVRVAVDAAGSQWFSITPTGAYLLGHTDKFQYEVDEPTGQVFVQPNFEIVFTAPNPAAESELAQFSERIGHGLGTLFRITRQSVHAAIDCGINAEPIMEILRSYAHKALPPNVVTQIKGWAGAYRRVSFRRMQTMTCPDAETALQVLSLFPRLTKPVTDTILEVTNQKSLSDIKKKLRKHGIGIE